MRICLLTTQDLDEDPFPDYDWPCDPRPFLPRADWTLAVLEKETAVADVEALIDQGFDLFFNLCDGPAGTDRPGIAVVRTLEKHGVAFTGATSRFFEPTRTQQKRACLANGIATPAWVIARSESGVERAARTLRFPQFVKHPNSYASVDLTRASRVATPAGLRRQARKIIARYGSVLIEEFVEGREYTVFVAENPVHPTRPTTYQPIGYQFPEGESFKHEQLKWETFDDMACAPVTDRSLVRRLRDVSARFFTAIGGASYGRCDIRVDESGTPWMLEINPNCGLYYPESAASGADLCLLNSRGGHAAFTRQIVRAALARQARRCR